MSLHRQTRDNGNTPAESDFDERAASYVQAVDRSISFTGRDAAFFATRKVDLLGRLLEARGRELRSTRVLDVGCGTGMTAQFLVNEVRGLEGVDVSTEMLAQARDNVTGAHFQLYDGRHLPYDSDSFDLVLAICVLHHVPELDRQAFVAELNRVTRPDGLIAIFEHNPLNPLTKRAVNSCELDDGVTLLRARTVVRLLEAAGAERPRVRYLLFTPMGGRIGTLIDSMLGWIPLGGQHVTISGGSQADGRGSS